MSNGAFDAFYRENYLRVLKYTLRRLADVETSKEVTADCFIVAWKKFDSTDPFPLPWLYATARNLIGNAYQKRDREQRLTRALDAQVSRTPDLSDFSNVFDALELLSEADREILHLTYWEQLSAAEVAATLGCSESAAWKRVSRARLAMREALAPTLHMWA